MFKGIRFLLRKNPRNIFKINIYLTKFSTEVNPINSLNFEKEEELKKYLKGKYNEFKSRLISIIQINKKEDKYISDENLDEIIKIIREMSIESFTDQDILNLIELIKPRLSKQRPMKISTFMNVLKLISDMKIRDKEILEKCEKITLLRKKEILESGKENVLIIYQIFTILGNKNYIFWEEIEKLVLSVYEDLSFNEKSQLFKYQCENIKNEEHFEQIKKSILYKKLSAITDDFMVKKLTNEQYTSLLYSLTLQQVNVNSNYTIIINNFYQYFPIAIKTMNYKQGVFCFLSFLRTNFIIPESNLMKKFVEYIIKNTKYPNLEVDITLLLLGASYYDKTEWGEDLLKKIMEKLAIRRGMMSFIEDLNIYADHYEKTPENIQKFIVESSMFCRMNGFKRRPEIVEVKEDQSTKEGFFKDLDLSDVYNENVDGTNYNKI